MTTDQTLEQEPQPHIGDLLKNVRIQKGINLEEVANDLRISKRHLAQLEDHPEEVACNVYSLGFLKQYAKYLHLEEEPLLTQFKTKSTRSSLHSLSFPAPLPGRGRPNWKILSLCFLTLLTIILGWMWAESLQSPFEAFLVVD